MSKTKTTTLSPNLTPPVEDSVLTKSPTFRQLTVQDLEELAMQDPAKAQIYADLYEKLAKRKLKDIDDEALIKTQVMLLERITKQIQIEQANQRACEQHGHMREDNRTALVGQRDNFHNILLVCQRCQKHYHGVGEGPGKLPTHLATTIDMSLIGGVQ